MIHRCLFLLLALATTLPAAEEQARVSLQSITETRFSGDPPGELRLWVRLEASGLQDALEYSHVQITTARDDRGNDLTPPAPDTDTPPQPLRLTRGDGGAAPSVLFPVILRPAPRAARLLTEVSGTVTLHVFKRQVVLIEDARNRIGKTVEDPLFKAHGLEVFITDPAQGVPGLTDKNEIERFRERAIAVRISGENLRSIDATLANERGEVLPSRISSFGGGRSVLFTLTTDSPLAPDTRLRVTIPSAPRQAEVPFTLREILLP